MVNRLLVFNELENIFGNHPLTKKKKRFLNLGCMLSRTHFALMNMFFQAFTLENSFYEQVFFLVNELGQPPAEPALKLCLNKGISFQLQPLHFQLLLVLLRQILQTDFFIIVLLTIIANDLNGKELGNKTRTEKSALVFYGKSLQMEDVQSLLSKASQIYFLKTFILDGRSPPRLVDSQSTKPYFRGVGLGEQGDGGIFEVDNLTGVFRFTSK